MTRAKFNELDGSEQRLHRRRRLMVIFGLMILALGAVLVPAGARIDGSYKNAYMAFVILLPFAGYPSGISHAEGIRRSPIMVLMAIIPIIGWLIWVIVYVGFVTVCGWALFLMDLFKWIFGKSLVTNKDGVYPNPESDLIARIKTIAYIGVATVLWFTAARYLSTEAGYLVEYYESHDSAGNLILPTNRAVDLGEMRPEASNHFHEHGGTSTELTYTYDGVSWDNAFELNTRGGSGAAWAIYDIQGKGERIEFELTPRLGDGFDDDAVTELVIADGDTKRIVTSFTIDKTKYNSSFSADISGIRKLMFYAYTTQGNSGYLLMKNVSITTSEENIVSEQGGISLRDVDPAMQERIGSKLGRTYLCEGYIWDSALVFSPDEKEAFAVFEIGGAYSSIEFSVLPYVEEFNGTVTVSVTNEVSGEVLASTDINADSGIVDISADIGGVNRLGLRFKRTSGNKTQLLSQDIRLY